MSHKALKPLLAVLLSLALTACAGRVNSANNLRQYHLQAINLVVTDAGHANDTLFIDSLKSELTHAFGKWDDNASLPAVQLTINVQEMGHSKADGYKIHTLISLTDVASQRTLSIFPYNVTPNYSDNGYKPSVTAAQVGAPAATPGGAFISGSIVGALDALTEPDEADKTQNMIKTYALGLALKMH